MQTLLLLLHQALMNKDPVEVLDQARHMLDDQSYCLMAQMWTDAQASCNPELFSPVFLVSLEEWKAYISEKLQDYSQMSYPSEILLNVIQFLNGFKPPEPVTLTNSISLQNMATTSTSSTTAPSQATNVGAVGDKRPPSAKILDVESDDEDPFLQMLDGGIGSIYSYISSYRDLEKREFGVEEKSLDYRVRMYFYDPKQMKSPKDGWQHKIQEIDVTYARGGEMDQLIHRMIRIAYKQLKDQGANLKTTSKRSRFY